MKYFARQSGYEVNVTSKAHWTKIIVEEGVRGLNIPVTVSRLDDGTWCVSRNGQRLTVVSVEEVI